MGIADSMLQTVRSRVARAAAPQAGGKNVDATLYVLDGAHGTLDPAFEAHTAPVKLWAMAWWERWFPREEIDVAFQVANLKLAAGRASLWSKVTGPVTAMLASLRRLGWRLPCPWEAIDDRGASWNYLLDPPAAIVGAVKQSVRRWRLGKLSQTMPALVPRVSDAGPPGGVENTIVVDFAATLGQFMRSSFRHKHVCFWSPKWRGDLASAVSGGQWTQTRKAAVPRWNIEDRNCQLCHAALGTLEHRWCCNATRPPNGWPAAPSQAALVLGRIGQDRRRLLQTRAVLALRLPKPPTPTEWFTWHLAPPEEAGPCTWYLDGSLLDGGWADFRAAGFGIVVVSNTRELVAYGSGGRQHGATQRQLPKHGLCLWHCLVAQTRQA